jgi:hypothetical protein
MKNIHILPTDKPSRLFKVSGELKLTRNFDFYNGSEYQNVYITSDEEIKEGDWFHLDMSNNDRPDEIHKMGTNKRSKTGGINFSEPNSWTKSCKKIILTTDQDLIKDGVQSIDDGFLGWFVKNPSCEFVEVEKKSNIEIKEISYEGDFQNVEYVNYKIIIPQEDINFFQITVNSLEKSMNLNLEYINDEPLEAAAEKEYDDNLFDYEKYRDGFIEGAKWQQEDMIEKLEMHISVNEHDWNRNPQAQFKDFIEQFKNKL